MGQYNYEATDRNEDPTYHVDQGTTRHWRLLPHRNPYAWSVEGGGPWQRLSQSSSSMQWWGFCIDKKEILSKDTVHLGTRIPNSILLKNQ